MSADHWGICPRCKDRLDKEIKSHEQKVVDAYGKLPVEEYLALRNYKFPEQRPSLREDYEIGISPDGEFYVTYNGYCNVCLFKYDYRYKVQVYS